MAIKYIDMTGKTEDEAIRKALDQLGLDRDDVSVEVLERAKKGFFGFGASPAKVRVTYGLEDEPVAPPPPKEKPVPSPAAPAPKPVEKAPEKRPERKPEKPAEKPAVKAEKAEKPAAPEEKEAGGPRPEKRERRRRDRSRGERKGQEKPAAPAAEQRPVPPPPQPEELGEPCDDAKAQQIVAFLNGLLEHMDSAAEVKVYKGEENRYKVILEGEKLGHLIGRRGETLDAIQQLTNYAVNKSGEKRVRIHVDAENYRLKREQSLQHLALKMADKVLRNKRNCTLEPMNAYERHVIHTALQDVENITTYSMGTEPNRRVIVAYDKNKQKQE